MTLDRPDEIGMSIRAKLFAAALCVSILATCITTAYLLGSRFASSNKKLAVTHAAIVANRNAIKDNKVTWHKVICHLARASAKNKTLPYAARVRAVTFYNLILYRDVGTDPCEIRIPRR